MNSYTLQITDTRASLETTGGKGASLTRMVNAGLPVPGGFHLTTAAYRDFVRENHLQLRIMAALENASVESPASLETASQAIRQLFEDAQIPAEIEMALVDAYAAMQNAPVAVRSSATAEDLPDASFAGQQDTYLNVRGADALLAAVRACWASLWTPRAIAYRMKNAIDQEAVALAVVVQELVFADAAGILFTANPINGRRGELLINAAWGLGEAIVSGAVTPDTIVYDKLKGRIASRKIAEKEVMTVRTRTGTEEQPVPADKKKKAALSKEHILELAQLAMRIEAFYEMPMDVEWALAGGKFAILQARPITVLPVDWIVPDTRAIWARGSLAEHTPSPVTPLFATFGLEIANEATTRMWEQMIGKKAKDIMPSGGGMYVPLNGYVFGGVRMTGKEILTIMKMSLSQIGPMFKGSVARWQTARTELVRIVEQWEQKNLAEMTPSELVNAIRTVFLASCTYFTRIQTTLPAASSSEVMFTRLYNSLVKRKGDPEATTFLVGTDTVSLQAEKSLYDLAEWIEQDAHLTTYVQCTGTGDLLERMKGGNTPEDVPAQVWIAWCDRFWEHLQRYGRTAYEFDFAMPTPLEKPGPMIDAIKGYLSGESSSPHARQQEMVERREALTRQILARTHWPLKGWFTRLLRWAQETGPMRENSIFDMGMAHPLVRRMFAELAGRLVMAGALNDPDDIYWLEKDELMGLVAGLERSEALPNLSDRVPAHKEQWLEALKVMPPVMLPERTGWKKLIHGGEIEKKDGKTILSGVGTSSGVVTAPARVIFSPEDFGNLRPGDVLVAVTTTPAWTPLFAIASAVVTDIGGPLSHSSIVAREYGIPAVMAARNATRTIQNGQILTVDGASGKVVIEQ
jgi:rifampicin phosphotransferase